MTPIIFQFIMFMLLSAAFIFTSMAVKELISMRQNQPWRQKRKEPSVEAVTKYMKMKGATLSRAGLIYPSNFGLMTTDEEFTEALYTTVATATQEIEAPKPDDPNIYLTWLDYVRYHPDHTRASEEWENHYFPIVRDVAIQLLQDVRVYRDAAEVAKDHGNEETAHECLDRMEAALAEIHRLQPHLDADWAERCKRREREIANALILPPAVYVKDPDDYSAIYQIGDPDPVTYVPRT